MKMIGLKFRNCVSSNQNINLNCNFPFVVAGDPVRLQTEIAFCI
jgi:hypothetical protein